MSGSDEPPGGSPDGGGPHLDDYGESGGPDQGPHDPGPQSHGQQSGYAHQPGFDPPTGGAGQFATRQRGKSNKSLVVGLLGGSAVLLVLIAIVGVRLSGGPQYVISTPSTAGGYVLVSPHGSTNGDDRSDARALGIKADSTKSAIYKDPASSSSPPADVSFLGVTGDIGDPYTFLHNNRLATNPSARVIDTDAGGAGKAVCVTVTGATIISCMWATKHSFGMITPITPRSVNQVAGMMRRLRPDLEHPK